MQLKFEDQSSHYMHSSVSQMQATTWKQSQRIDLKYLAFL
jgi:hypothetical protein